MAKVTVLNHYHALHYEQSVPVISFNEWTHKGPQSPYPLGDHHIDIQRIYCDDVTEEIDSTYRLFDYIDAIKILTFLERHKGQDIMTHCHKGISRSPACAKFMIDYLGYSLDTQINRPTFAEAHNTHVYYTLKRAMLDHLPIIERIKGAHNA